MTLIFYKKHKGDKIWWVRELNAYGKRCISFDKKNVLNIFKVYPDGLTSEQKELFDKENPFWKDFFKGRMKKRGD